MKTKLYYIYIVLLIGIFPLTADISNGIIDLRGLNGSSDKAFAVKGWVPLYWEQFITPEILNDSLSLPVCAMNIPGIWNDISSPSGPLPGKGFCSIIIHVIPPVTPRKLAIKLPAIRTAYRLFLDTTFITSVGVPGKTEKSSKPAYRTQAISLPIRTEPYNLIFHISNFENNKGGPWKPIFIGDFYEIFRIRNIALSYDLFFIGILIFFVFIHCTSYRFSENHEERKALSALTAFTIAILTRTALTGERFLYLVLPDVSSLYMVRFEYISFFLAGIFFHIFVHYSFKHISSRKVCNTAISIGTVFIFIVLFTPLSIHSRIIPLFQITIFFFMLYQIAIAFLSRKEPGIKGIVLMVSILILFISALHDILGAHGVTILLSLTPIANVIVILIQTVLITIERAKMYHQRMAMAHRFTEINTTLNQFVPEKILNLLGTTVESVDSAIEKEFLLTVMVADIRGFTALSERMSPEMTFSFINRFLAEATPHVTNHNGFINSFIGDAFVAVFSGKPSDAVEAAMKIQKQLNSSELFSSYMLDEPLRLGIGIEYGETTLGILGGSTRMENTLLGDNVTSAFRLEELTKYTGAHILISECIYSVLKKENYTSRYLGTNQLKTGKKKIYELFVDDDSPDTKRKRRTQKTVEKAADFIDRKLYAEAIHSLSSIPSEVAVHDHAIAYLMEKCRKE